MRTLKIASAIGAIVLAGTLGLTACSSGDKSNASSSASAADEGVGRSDPVNLSGEVQAALVGLLRLDLRHLRPRQVAHEFSFHGPGS